MPPVTDEGEGERHLPMLAVGIIGLLLAYALYPGPLALGGLVVAAVAFAVYYWEHDDTD